MHEQDTRVERPTVDKGSALRSTLGLSVLCALAIVGVIALVEVRDPSALLAQLSQGRTELHGFVTRLGVWAPIAFIAAYAALMLLIWFPSWPCSMMGGFLFDAAGGTIYSLVGSTIGAVVVFELARAGLADRRSLQHPIVRRLDMGFQRDALEYVVALRVMPVMPFGIVHVAAGAFHVPLRTFTIGTAIGMIPCVLIYALLGADLDRIFAKGGHVSATTFLSPAVFGPLFALAALALVPVAVRRLRERRSPS